MESNASAWRELPRDSERTCREQSRPLTVGLRSSAHQSFLSLITSPPFRNSSLAMRSQFLVFVRALVIALPVIGGQGKPVTDSTRSTTLDILVIHGSLIDGSGAPPQQADLGIRGGRIAF